MIDVDHFKDYNDAHGHPSGDQVLLEVARVLAAHVEKPSWVCRYGGEEFLIVLRGATLEQGIQLAEQLRQTVQTLRLPHQQSAHGVVTISVGVANIDPRLHPLDAGWPQLIRDADRALYRAKRGGRNRVESGLPGIG
jgi:diguanylate cyclase (GGDEF)-like protein